MINQQSAHNFPGYTHHGGLQPNTARRIGQHTGRGNGCPSAACGFSQSTGWRSGCPSIRGSGPATSRQHGCSPAAYAGFRCDLFRGIWRFHSGRSAKFPYFPQYRRGPYLGRIIRQRLAGRVGLFLHGRSPGSCGHPRTGPCATSLIPAVIFFYRTEHQHQLAGDFEPCNRIHGSRKIPPNPARMWLSSQARWMR